MKPDLLILSDLWGFEKSDWVHYYVSLLQLHFNVSLLDSCKLGGINHNNTTESEIHTQFLEFGIKNAVNTIVKIKSNTLNVLAFSVGGTITWEAALEGLGIQNMYLISSTRLRYKIDKPKGNIHLLYGEDDIYKPSIEWFQKMKLAQNFVPNAKHELYKEKDIATTICKNILQSYNNR